MSSWDIGAWQGEQSIVSGVSSWIIERAENISVGFGTDDLVEAAGSHGQLVDGVSCLRAVEGRRMEDT